MIGTVNLYLFFYTKEIIWSDGKDDERGNVVLRRTPWTVARQAPLSLEFPRQEYWSGLPFPSSGDLPDPGIKPTSHMSPALAGGFFTISTTWEAPLRWHCPNSVLSLTPSETNLTLNFSWRFFSSQLFFSCCITWRSLFGDSVLDNMLFWISP